MAIVNTKILGQSNPAATTATTLYTVPSSTSTRVTTIAVCNTSNAARTFRLWFAIAAAIDTTAQYLYYGTALAANDTFIVNPGEPGFTLGTGDLIRIYASNNDLAFTAYGEELVNQ